MQSYASHGGVVTSIENFPHIILRNADGRTDVDGGLTTRKGGNSKHRFMTTTTK